ncbi:MAG: phage tail family protein [Anaerolineae bacterium]|nr:phage tail family protein [Anaerolineae bacterium]
MAQTRSQTSFGANMLSIVDGVPRTLRLPGMDGGYDLFGDSALPREVGQVRARFVVVAENAAAMAAARDAVLAMSGYGRARLVIEMHGGDQRWNWAKVNSISLPTEHDAIADRFAEATVDFQCALPHWYSTNDDSPQVEACSGAATTFTVTNAGNAIAVPIITIDPGSAISGGLTIQRLVSSEVADEIVYAAALISTDALIIDCPALSVTKNDADAYSTAFGADHSAWMRLLPGDNTIKVILGAAETADVTVEWDDCWY